MKSLSKADIEYLLKNHYSWTIDRADELIKILQELVKRYSPTGKEKEISEFVISFVKDLKKFDVWDDELGNVFVSPKGKNPSILLNAHLDVEKNGNYGEDNLEKINLKDIDYKENGLLKPAEYEDIQIGYDDKIGVAISLWLLKHSEKNCFKALFCVREESDFSYIGKLEDFRPEGRNGGVGIGFILKNEENINFFSGIKTCLLVDRGEDKIDIGELKEKNFINFVRKEPGDLVWIYCEKKMCSDDFISFFEQHTKNLGTPMTRAKSGAKADAFTIKNRFEHVNILNISAGGYQEHNANDFLNVFEAVRTLRVVEKFLS